MLPPIYNPPKSGESSPARRIHPVIPLRCNGRLFVMNSDCPCDSKTIFLRDSLFPYTISGKLSVSFTLHTLLFFVFDFVTFYHDNVFTSMKTNEKKSRFLCLLLHEFPNHIQTVFGVLIPKIKPASQQIFIMSIACYPVICTWTEYERIPLLLQILYNLPLLLIILNQRRYILK